MDMVLADPGLIGQTRSVWVLAASDIDMVLKGHADRAVPEESRRVNDRQLAWMGALEKDGALRLSFNTRFFTGADSRYPELVGILGGILGSLYTLAITLALAFPLGVMAAIYLEEFAPKNRITDLIEGGRGAVDRLRPARARRLPERLRHAALRTACRWLRARPDEPADHHHRRARRAARRAALDPRGGARARCLQAAGRVAPRAAAGDAICQASSPARSCPWRTRWERPRRCS